MIFPKITVGRRRARRIPSKKFATEDLFTPLTRAPEQLRPPITHTGIQHDRLAVWEPRARFARSAVCSWQQIDYMYNKTSTLQVSYKYPRAPHSRGL